MDNFNRISYLEKELNELGYLELKVKALKGKWVPYTLYNNIINTKINITQILGGIINE